MLVSVLSVVLTGVGGIRMEGRVMWEQWWMWTSVAVDLWLSSGTVGIGASIAVVGQTACMTSGSGTLLQLVSMYKMLEFKWVKIVCVAVLLLLSILHSLSTIATIFLLGCKFCFAICDGCGFIDGHYTEGVGGMLWRCTKCHNYGLCTACYMSGKHCLEHKFKVQLLNTDPRRFVLHNC